MKDREEATIYTRPDGAHFLVGGLMRCPERREMFFSRIAEKYPESAVLCRLARENDAEPIVYEICGDSISALDRYEWFEFEKNFYADIVGWSQYPTSASVEATSVALKALDQDDLNSNMLFFSIEFNDHWESFMHYRSCLSDAVKEVLITNNVNITEVDYARMKGGLKSLKLSEMFAEYW